MSKNIWFYIGMFLGLVVAFHLCACSTLPKPRCSTLRYDKSRQDVVEDCVEEKDFKQPQGHAS